MLDHLLQDLKHALRMFVQSPAFTLAAVAALTLGIGTNTAIFSVVNAVLLRPASVPDPDRFVIFMNTSPQGSGPAASPAKFQHYRRQSAVVEDVAAFNTGVVNYTGGSAPEQLRSARVSAGVLPPLRRAPGPRPHLHRRRRPARRSARGGARSELLGDPVRPGSWRGRSDDLAER